MYIRFNPIAALCSLAVGVLVSCEPAPPKVSAANHPASAEVVKISLPDRVSFNEHIQPILSENCYHCHGPDSGTREPKKVPLRLDRVADAFAIRDNEMPVIIKGKPAESALIKRILTTDPDEIMPPLKSHKSLKPREIALLTRWIEQGAEYEPHWSFAQVVKPAVPEAVNNWAANPIDRFIAEKLETEGLKPNAPEDSARFYRRLHLDLTGLPPAPEEIDSFVKSVSADPQAAIEAAADRLLTTTASAEHFARHWLTPRVTRTPTASTSTTIAPSGRTATGSSGPSKRTCRGTNSPLSKSPATCCLTAHLTSSSPPVSPAASPPPAKAGRSPRNTMRFTPRTAWKPSPRSGSV